MKKLLWIFAVCVLLLMSCSVLRVNVEGGLGSIATSFFPNLETGWQPSVAINNSGSIVQVYRSFHHNTLWYRVGKVFSSETLWSEERQYDRGHFPKIALNDQGVVVEVHMAESEKSIYYRVGVLDDSQIDFGPSYHFERGSFPNVSITNDNLVVTSHTGLSDETLWYRIGKVDPEQKTIEWYTKPNEKYDSGNGGVIAVNDHGLIIEVHQSAHHRLTTWYRKGKLAPDNRCIIWSDISRELIEGPTGMLSAVSLCNDGRIVVVSAMGANILDNRTFEYIVGHINADASQIGWTIKQTMAQIVGDSFSIALRNRSSDERASDSNMPDFALVYTMWNSHVSNGPFFLHDQLGFIEENRSHLVFFSQNWMKLLFNEDERKQTPLYKMTLPASHDSGTWSIDHLEGFTRCQKYCLYHQLYLGARFFDLRFHRIISATGDTCFLTYHGKHPVTKEYLNSNVTLDEVLDNTVGFLQSVDGEIVILNFSHFAKFDSDQHHELFLTKIVQRLEEWLPDPSMIQQGKVLSLTYEQLTEKGSIVLVIYRDGYGDYHEEALVRMGIIPRNYFPVYDDYSNSPHPETVTKDQLKKLAQNPGNNQRLFLLSWTLTPNSGHLTEVKILSKKINPLLNNYLRLLQNNQVNFLYHDFVGYVGGSDFLKTAVFLNLHSQDKP